MIDFNRDALLGYHKVHRSFEKRGLSEMKSIPQIAVVGARVRNLTTDRRGFITAVNPIRVSYDHSPITQSEDIHSLEVVEDDTTMSEQGVTVEIKQGRD